MAKSLQFGNIVLCEYVAKGEGNKFTLVNTYSGDVIVPSFPVMLQFGLFVEYKPSNIGELRITLEFKLDTETFAEVRVDAKVDSLSGPACIALPSLQMQLDKERTLQVFAKSEGYSRSRILSKRIYAAARSSH